MTELIAPCQHCEERPGVTKLGLCVECHAKIKIRTMYVPKRTRKPADESIIARFRERAKRGLPLFEEETLVDLT
jgi:hypothetical protein